MKINLLNITAKCLSKMNGNFFISSICGIVVIFLSIFILLSFKKHYLFYYRAILNFRKEFEKDKKNIKKILLLSIGYYIGYIVYLARKHKKENKPFLEGFSLGNLKKIVYAGIITGLCLLIIISMLYVIVTDFFNFLNGW